MPTKRAILSELTRDELRDHLDYYGLDVHDRRVRSQLIDTLAGSRKARLDEMLWALSRDRLKALCRAFDLDDSGRKKGDLVERLISPTAAKNARGGAGADAAAPAVETADPPPETLGVEQLERYLWSAADILRGSIDSSDYKTYIFGLLFLKRLSDRFEEEAEKLVADGVSEDVAWTDPDEHPFFVPDRARWGAIQKRPTNIGEALNKACAALEEQNPALEGVLAGIDYNDERRLGDARNRDTVLARLVQHFSQVSLRNDRMAEPDLLGRAYEYLIEQFADDAGKKGGEFYTPRMVVKLIVELLAPTERMRICDPTAGSGGMLIECAHHIERQAGNPRNLTLHGQEKNLSTWAICKMNMLLHGLPDARIEKGDTIRDPKLADEGELLLYDRVIANPPFSLDEWGRDVAESDGYGRFRFGVPPKTRGDLAFVQHMVAVLNARGRLGVVMPHGVLFRGAAEGKIRQGLLRDDLFEAVIGLAAEPLLRHRHSGVHPGAEPQEADGPSQGHRVVHRRLRPSSTRAATRTACANEPVPDGAGVRRLTAYARRAGSQKDRPSSSSGDLPATTPGPPRTPSIAAGTLVGQEHVAATGGAASSRDDGDSDRTIQDVVHPASIPQRRVDPAGTILSVSSFRNSNRRLAGKIPREATRHLLPRPDNRLSANSQGHVGRLLQHGRP